MDDCYDGGRLLADVNPSHLDAGPARNDFLSWRIEELDASRSSANFWNVAGSLAEFTSPLASSSFHRPLRFRRQFHHPLRLFQVLVVFFLNLMMDDPFSDCESQVQTVEDAGQRVHHQLDHLRFLRLLSPPTGRLLGVQGPLVFRSNRYLIRNVIRSCIVCAF